MELKIYINETFEEEKALCLLDKDDLKVLILGDYYHNKINEMIEGFLLGLKYCNKDYNIEDGLYLNPLTDEKLFKAVGFYDNN